MGQIVIYLSVSLSLCLFIYLSLFDIWKDACQQRWTPKVQTLRATCRMNKLYVELAGVMNECGRTAVDL